MDKIAVNVTILQSEEWNHVKQQCGATDQTNEFTFSVCVLYPRHFDGGYADWAPPVVHNL